MIVVLVVVVVVAFLNKQSLKFTNIQSILIVYISSILCLLCNKLSKSGFNYSPNNYLRTKTWRTIWMVFIWNEIS